MEFMYKGVGKVLGMEEVGVGLKSGFLVKKVCYYLIPGGH